MSTTLAQAPAISPFDLEAYDYELPAGAIAQTPAARRDEARLLVLDRRTGGRRHLRVRDLPRVLVAGDLLVMNDTRVIPARLRGTTATGATVEVLLVRPTPAGTWLCLGRPAKRLKVGREIELGGPETPARPRARVVAQEEGRVELEFDGDVDEILARCGELPLPPYIERRPGAEETDRERYQTVYARVPGAIAAPTAGLHFTPELLDDLAGAGVETAMITLHVGPGTFLPVRVADVRRHRMEPEWAVIAASAADRIAAAKREGRRVIAIGTTTTRALEARGGAAGEGWADCFLTPGSEFRVIDGLLTNFHLPKSTLLMLVAALAGRETILDVYREALERGYRFYSYGDATLIL